MLIMNLKYFYKSFLLVVFIGISHAVIAQDNYQKGWQALNNADLQAAISHFEAASKESTNSQEALLVLSQLYPRVNQSKKAREVFQTFYNEAEDPFVAMYPLYFSEAVTGGQGAPKTKKTLSFMESVYKDKRRKGKLDNALDYTMGLHYAMTFDKNGSRKYHNKITNLRDWLCLGPFDNVMNSGFEKDFGVLDNPQKEATFISKYGAPITWFDPPSAQSDGYIFKQSNFRGYNSLVYYQTFINSSQANEVLMKIGYSGSLKVWVNDVLVHSIPEKRSTEMDYYQYKGELPKGYSRLLIQLGDYNTSDANFTIRFTDLEHNPVSFPSTNDLQTYPKGSATFSAVPFFAVEALKSKMGKNPNDLLYPLLLAKSYMRSNEINEAENILIRLHKEYPKNYLLIRNLILLYDKSGNSTEQNRFYELFEKTYPDDMDILSNEIEKHTSQKDKKEFESLITKFDKLYGNEYTRLSYASVLANLNEDYEKVVGYLEDMYEKFPDRYDPVISKYRIEKELYNSPQKANKILEKYLKNHYDYKIINTLSQNYIDEGKRQKSVDLIEKTIDLFDFDIDAYRKLVNIYYKQKNYNKAIQIAENIITIKPSDYETLKDLAVLHNIKGNKEEARRYYKESLKYFPFSFEVNEKLRSLNNQTAVMEMIEKIDPDDAISAYEKGFVAQKKEIYDIVVNNRSFIIFESKAIGSLIEYIVKINDEEAIQQYQSIQFSPGNNFRGFINEAQTIKANGNKIDAERNGGNVTFTQLEIGDYVYVSYSEMQTGGGKSSRFVYDDFNFDSYVPTYRVKYQVFAEEGVDPNFKALNHNLKPEKSSEEGFNIYTWNVENPTPIKNEAFTLPYADLGQTIHVSFGDDWYDIAQWYSDLSEHQARPDYTIETIANQLFEKDKSYTKEEKAKIIYDFVIKNIQYSSLDFRQSSFIPQKASEIYHSRLGDCKDLSTLYSSIARSVGLKSNLVLINTRNNGQNDVVVPSLNFNHCIVKVELDNEPMYLELTDPELPFGHLYYYHHGAAILEIPFEDIQKDIRLTYLKPNKGRPDIITRKTKVVVNLDNSLSFHIDAVKEGTRAAATVNSFYNKDQKDNLDNLQSNIGNRFNSQVIVKNADFSKLEPRATKAIYDYDFTVENELLKVGSFTTLKLPFADVLATIKIFDEEERTHVFDFKYYETTDSYDETIEITIPEGNTFLEIPENLSLEYKGNKYILQFEQLNERTIKVQRVYTTNRENIAPEDFKDFEVFIKKVIEAEKTHLVFK